jgi:hypothetical protein
MNLTYSTSRCRFPRQTYDTFIARWTVKQIFDQSVDIRRRLKSNYFYLVLISLQFIRSLPLQGFSQLFYVTLDPTCKILQPRNTSRRVLNMKSGRVSHIPSYCIFCVSVHLTDCDVHLFLILSYYEIVSKPEKIQTAVFWVDYVQSLKDD